MRIGPWTLDGKLILAPMAGITDLPFRQSCRKHGASLAISEMVSSDLRLINTKKTRLRLTHEAETAPVIVQIVGTEPHIMAQAAKFNVDNGAQIIDINMGCPAKKVCKKASGSALLRDELLVGRILEAVVDSVKVPVTLKIRTGWSPAEKNAPRIAKIAEQSGVAALSIHGRTRACMFNGDAEYQTIKAVKKCVKIPVIANGDISTPKQARHVLDETGADALMIGRAALGWPWIFSEINADLSHLPWHPPTHREQKEVILGLLNDFYHLYGELSGLRIARKHLGWYLERVPGGSNHKKNIYSASSASEQVAAMNKYFDSAAFEKTHQEDDRYARSCSG